MSADTPLSPGREYDLEVSGVSVVLDGVPIVGGAFLQAAPGELLGIVGPNGSGKSTLLRTMYRALRPAHGTVHVMSGDVWSGTARESARRIAAVVQEAGSDFTLTVIDVVAMGRNPHKRSLERDSADDLQTCLDALERTGASRFADRDFDTLSGGEKQRVLLARAIAQQPRLLVLDEPTNHLDIRFQLDLLNVIRGLGVTTVVVLHDLALAAAHCDRIYVMDGGRMVAQGPPDEVLTPALVAEVFGVRAHHWVDEETQQAHLTFSRLPAHDSRKESSI